MMPASYDATLRALERLRALRPSPRVEHARWSLLAWLWLFVAGAMLDRSRACRARAAGAASARYTAARRALAEAVARETYELRIAHAVHERLHRERGLPGEAITPGEAEEIVA